MLHSWSDFGQQLIFDLIPGALSTELAKQVLLELGNLLVDRLQPLHFLLDMRVLILGLAFELAEGFRRLLLIRNGLARGLLRLPRYWSFEGAHVLLSQPFDALEPLLELLAIQLPVLGEGNHIRKGLPLV